MSLSKVLTCAEQDNVVYRTLLDAINNGTLAPGAHVTQEDPAEQLNTPRSPVLQAPRLLKKERPLEDAPRRGPQVTPLEPDRIGQLYQVRAALDALAARLAAERQADIPAALVNAGSRSPGGRGRRRARDDRGRRRVPPHDLRSQRQSMHRRQCPAALNPTVSCVGRRVVAHRQPRRHLGRPWGDPDGHLRWRPCSGSRALGAPRRHRPRGADVPPPAGAAVDAARGTRPLTILRWAAQSRLHRPLIPRGHFRRRKRAPLCSRTSTGTRRAGRETNTPPA